MKFAEEAGRLAALDCLNVLDTAPEPVFDGLTRLAADTFAAPIALISLVSSDRQWFKAAVGLDATETSREVSFCSHAIRRDEVMVVLDARQDPRFADNALVTGPPDIRFYAGAPLIDPAGHALGTLCVIDTKPREAFTAAEQARLSQFAGCVMQALTMRMDALDKRNAARIAAEQHQLLELAERMAGVGTWSWDVATNRTTWSHEVYRIHGFDSSATPPGLDGVLATYHPDDAPRLAEKVERAIRDAIGYDLQARVRRGDGTYRDVIAQGACSLGSEGEVIGLFGTFQDVTELKLADAALRASEARARYLADNSTDMLVRVDRQGVILEVSAACRAYGYTPEDLTGLNTLSLVHPDDLASAIAANEQNFSSKGPSPDFVRQFRVRSKSGEYAWVHGNPTVVRDQTGEAVEVINTFRDVTARMKLEADLKAARQAAEQALAVKADFLANMSHEIRTPLTAILGFNGLLSQRSDLSPEARRYVQRITSAGDGLLCIVNDILDFSKIEAGSMPVRVRAADPTAVLNDVAAMFSQQAEAKGLRLEVELEGDLPDCLIFDPDRLRQVLMNLVGNAIKFTDAGSVRLGGTYDDAAAELQLSVEDTGPGMSRRDQGLLFKRFSQVDGSSTRRHGGTGLGLAICKGLVEAMGGEIGVRSWAGRGSVFHARIPAGRGEFAAAGWERTNLDIAGLRVLVVDDNPANRDLARAILEPAGAEVTEAADGQAAIDAALAKPFDVILMDMRMPGMDGAAAASRLRALPGPNRDIAILVFSADATDSESGPPTADFDGWVRKPILAASLLSAVHDACASRDATLMEVPRATAL